MHHTFIHAHTPTHNLWFWPKRPPLAFSMAETSVAEMLGPKRPRPKCPWPKCPWPKCPTFCSGPASNIHPQKISRISSTPNKYLKFKQPKKYPPFCTLTFRKDPKMHRIVQFCDDPKKISTKSSYPPKNSVF